jgi:hypothetical protein
LLHSSSYRLGFMAAMLWFKALKHASDFKR